MLAHIRAQLGLDKSLPEQFLLFAHQVLTLDFGTSWSTQQPVSDIIGSRIGPSLTLTGAMLVVDLLVAIPLAALVAYFRGGLTDHIVTISCTVAMSISALIYIIAGQFFLGFKLGWFPVRGWGDSFWVNLLRKVSAAGGAGCFATCGFCFYVHGMMKWFGAENCAEWHDG
ncbi:ABC transporter permease [Chromobacterium vaccinii]|uniref:ABC transporter permease n=1 Tax=Chromobacterium vaccinii TaxID=1108595 RepID=UPI00164184AB|nr:ABC transporter permease [Chromobacterium vaccinii]